ncbi:MAG: carbon-nitrogen hydrolase family protein [Deltaproteobacteria bacterium]|jgi:predicted amidohydrolase|nr:carbon-nitrogen hydrolase family protein [Deltaproteobacteria bacterium]
MPPVLKTALLHMEVLHGKPAENRKLLLSLCAEAAARGAKMILGPEMCLSGYSFKNREAMAPFAEPALGPTGKALAKLAREKGVYVISAWAEEDEESGIFFNSAFAFTPKGDLAARYRKMNAESRWACPGPPRQKNVFETPWGTAGLLICSDSYHSLPMRITALRGANLVFLPSNWPPTRSFPRDVWRFRAMENKTYLLAVNRGGVEKGLDCSGARSHVFGPEGESLLDAGNPRTEIFYADIPLDENGKFGNIPAQKEFFASRRPREHYRLYSNLLFFKNLSSFLELPPPGPQDTHFIAPGAGVNPADFLEGRLALYLPGQLLLLPEFPYRSGDKDRLFNLAAEKKLKILTLKGGGGLKGGGYWIFDEKFAEIPQDSDAPIPPRHLGSLVVGLTDVPSMLHPERAVAAAKNGCDLYLALGAKMNPEDRFIAAMRTIDQLAAAVVTQTGAAVSLIPEGHSPPRGAVAGEGSGVCYNLDSRELRDKHFQDRLDFEVLFQSRETILKGLEAERPL